MLERAVEAADLNALRMALWQVTGDEALGRMSVVKVPVWGGVMVFDQLAPEHHEEVKAKAIAYLSNPPEKVPPPISREEAPRLVASFEGVDRVSDALFGFAWEELAFDDFPREVKWHEKPSPEILKANHVTIIGAGVSGILAGVQLSRLGIPYTIFERHSDMGGTWHVNRYPEARVDITSYIYQYHFEKNYRWKSYFSDREETHNYLRFIAEKYDVLPNIRCGNEVTEARWNEEASAWDVTVRTGDGEEQTIRSQFLLSASGLFNKPKLPAIPGLETFEGAVFHTTQWDESYDYSGKRIALIGNGSTGCQALPALAEKGESVTIFMRTPHWVFPMENYKGLVAPEVNWMLDHMPYYWNWFCYGRSRMSLRLQDVGEYDPEWQAKGGIISERNDRLRDTLTTFIGEKMAAKPELAEKLIPSWPPLARRPVVDSGWYDALLRENVAVVRTSIDHIEPRGIVDSEGELHELDLIVLATGFEVSRFLWPVRYTGRSGVTLEQAWSEDGARAYLGMSIPNFPNFFMFYGPNSQPRGGGGLHTWAEMWGRYIVNAIVHTIEGGHASIEVRPEAYHDYNRSLDERAKFLVRNSEGKGSYHINEFGRLVTNVPWDAEEYSGFIRHPEFDKFILS
jgi:4-hydroxyacetophenone monooxygenase